MAALTTMAREMGVTVLAEGVETAAQLAAVRAVGVDLVQGYLHGRPMSTAGLEERVGLKLLA